MLGALALLTDILSWLRVLYRLTNKLNYPYMLSGWSHRMLLTLVIIQAVLYMLARRTLNTKNLSTE